MKVRQGLLKFISPKVPVETRRAVAKTVAKGFSTESIVVEGETLSCSDALTILFILGFDSDTVTSTEAASGLTSFNSEQLERALGKKLDPRLLKKLAVIHALDPSVLSLIDDNPGADSSIKEFVRKKMDVQTATVAATETVTVKSEDGEEIEELEEENIYNRIKTLNTAEKIKLALTGGKTERTLLVTDANKVVSNSVLRNPRISENEIITIVNSKTASDEVLKFVAQNKHWMKCMSVRLGLIKNPKTPLPISMRQLDYISKRELGKLAKSKNISSVLSSNALRKMERIR